MIFKINCWLFSAPGEELGLLASEDAIQILNTKCTNTKIVFVFFQHLERNSAYWQVKTQIQIQNTKSTNTKIVFSAPGEELGILASEDAIQIRNTKCTNKKRLHFSVRIALILVAMC